MYSKEEVDKLLQKQRQEFEEKLEESEQRALKNMMIEKYRCRWCGGAGYKYGSVSNKMTCKACRGNGYYTDSENSARERMGY